MPYMLPREIEKFQVGGIRPQRSVVSSGCLVLGPRRDDDFVVVKTGLSSLPADGKVNI